MEKKQNKTLFKFVDFKKYTFIVPAIILALALLVMGIWGVNRALEYRPSHTYNINFNTTVSSKDFDKYKEIIIDTIKSESDNEFKVTVTKVNDDISSACKVNVYNNSDLTEAKFEDKLSNINGKIETVLNQQERLVSVRLTDVEVQEPATFGKSILFGSIAIVVFMAIAFAYFWFRFELKTALSSLLIAPYIMALTLSFMILFRIPFTDTFMLPVLFAEFIGYIMFVLVSDTIRRDLEDRDNNLTNEMLVYGSIRKNSTILLSLISSLCLIFVLLTFLFNITTLYLCITLLFSIVVAVYGAIIMPLTLWSMIYNKDKDNKLKAKIKILEDREAKKEAKSKSKTAETQKTASN